MFTLINMVPVNVIHVFKAEAEYDFFQPLEILGGQSLSDYYVFYPQQVSEVCKGKWQENEFVDGLL